MKELCRAEVFEFHRFLVKWFTERDEADELTFTEFTEVLANDFQMVSPNARIFSKDELRTFVWDAHGAHARDEQPFRIWVEGFDGRPIDDSHFLVLYEEWHETRGRVQGRLTTALFRKSEHARNGVEWVHIHETWVAPKDREEALERQRQRQNSGD